MDKYELAVIIVNYKTPRLVIDSLRTLLPELKGVNAKVVIVDNASNDGSITEIQSWLNTDDEDGKVNLIASMHNQGFSAGNNTGIKSVSARYYLLLNSDALVRKNAVKTLLQAAKDDPKAGLVGPRLEWPDGKAQESCFRFHSPLTEFITSVYFGPVARALSNFSIAPGLVDHSGYYDWSSFACVLIKSEVINDIGLMDEGYFMYYEDVAFSYHAKKKGWKVLNEPRAKVIHLRGGSSPVKSQAKQGKRLPRYYYESRTRFFFQAYGYLGMLLANIFWMIGWGFSNLRQLLSKDYTSSGHDGQWKDIWTNFFKPLRDYTHPNTYK